MPTSVRMNSNARIVRNVGERVDHRHAAAQGQAGGHADHRLLGDADVDEAVAERAGRMRMAARFSAVITMTRSSAATQVMRVSS